MGLPGVAVVLSGMSSAEQAEQNIATADRMMELSDSEISALEEISAVLRKKIAVPCTGCRYCCDGCPQKLDIPYLLSAYNEYRDDAETLKDRNMDAWRLSKIKALPEERQPAACIGCGNCKSHCPQSIDIPGCMEEMKTLL